MKQFIIILSLLLITVGCNKKEGELDLDYHYDNSLYQVYTPYRAGVNNNYNVNRIMSKLDLEEVELGLMRISTKYFALSKHYYQAGQYLTTDEIKELLSTEKLNYTDEVKDYKPKYISYIHEQNYLGKNGELKGISLGIVLNPYQTFVTEGGQTKTEEYDIETLIEFGKEKGKELYSYMKEKKELKDIEILIALYVQNGFTSLVPGSYKYESLSKGDNVNKYNKLEEEHHLLTSSYVNKNDIRTYDAFSTFKELISDEKISTSVAGRAFYQNKEIKEIKIDVNINYASLGEINALARLIADKLPSLFDNKCSIQVNIKDYSDIKAIIIKHKNESQSKLFLIN